MTTFASPTFASPTDVATHGEYTINRSADDPRPLYRFTGRISRDGSTPFSAEPDRYHLYAGWFCPWAQRTTLVVELAGLDLGVSYVDNTRDARGWAFRETNGPDPVNGFTLLRQAYEATEPGFDGHVSVPTLWDRDTGTVVSNDYGLLDVDLATQFDPGPDGFDLYPDELADQIDELESWIRPQVNQGGATQEGFARLEERLRHTQFLLGDELTLADVRLWVTLVRHDARAAQAGSTRLAEHPELWRYARDLYRVPAFRSTTDFASFGGADIRSDWTNQEAS